MYAAGALAKVVLRDHEGWVTNDHGMFVRFDAESGSLCTAFEWRLKKKHRLTEDSRPTERTWCNETCVPTGQPGRQGDPLRRAPLERHKNCFGSHLQVPAAPREKNSFADLQPRRRVGAGHCDPPRCAADAFGFYIYLFI